MEELFEGFSQIPKGLPGKSTEKYRECKISRCRNALILLTKPTPSTIFSELEGACISRPPLSESEMCNLLSAWRKINVFENYDSHDRCVMHRRCISRSSLSCVPDNCETCQVLLTDQQGNPGLVKYYEHFVKSLFADLDNGKTAVWALSHACHTVNIPPEKDGKILELYENSLDLEIEHKLQFIEQHVPPTCRISLIGHSIGCYMILTILLILQGLKARKYCHSKYNFLDTSKSYRKNPDLFSRIKHCYFLFPTIERMKDTPNGIFFWPLLRYFQSVGVFLIILVNLLPLYLKTKISQWSLGRKVTNSTMINATNELLTPKIFRSMLKLAYNELNTVNKLDIHAVESVKDKLTFYFGRKDKWCPLLYRDQLLINIPDLKNYVDELGIEHAFVLKKSVEMADKLSKIIKEN